MTALAEPLRLITVGPTQGNVPIGPWKANHTDDKPFMHRVGSRYYLSWGCFYATGFSPYGPFTYQGSVIHPSAIAPDFQVGSNATKPWYHQKNYDDRHGSFLMMHNQTYFVTNDQSHSSDHHDRDKFRDSVAGYVHYRENGTIAPVVINSQGVGGYDLRATWPESRGEIQAENYFRIVGAAEKREMTGKTRYDWSGDMLQDPGGQFEVRILSGGRAELHYPNVKTHLPRPVSSVIDGEIDAPQHNAIAHPAHQFGLRLRLRTADGAASAQVTVSLGDRDSVSCVLPENMQRDSYGWLWLPLPPQRKRHSPTRNAVAEDLILSFDSTGKSGQSSSRGTDNGPTAQIASAVDIVNFDKWAVGPAQATDHFCFDALTVRDNNLK